MDTPEPETPGEERGFEWNRFFDARSAQQVVDDLEVIESPDTPLPDTLALDELHMLFKHDRDKATKVLQLGVLHDKKEVRAAVISYLLAEVLTHAPDKALAAMEIAAQDPDTSQVLDEALAHDSDLIFKMPLDVRLGIGRIQLRYFSDASDSKDNND